MLFNLFRRAKINPVPQASPLRIRSVKVSFPCSSTLAGNQKKILIVDDDEILRKTTSLKLQSQGYAVATAIDASEAIGAVRDQRPDLVLLDLGFPPDVSFGGCVTWDGFQIMSWLRSFGSAARIPFIIMTAGEPAQYKERSLAAGAIAFFQKPINHQELFPVIKNALRQ